MLLASHLLAVHTGAGSSNITQTLLHLLNPEHWAVPVLAIVGGLLAVYSVRRGLAQDLPGDPSGTNPLSH